MGRVLVVYESMFGNTEVVARAVADGLAGHVGSDVAVELVEVADAPRRIADDVELVVAGAPTHGFGLSRPDSRAQATKQAHGAVVSRGRGLREWLAEVEAPSHPAATCFDTRMVRPRVLKLTPHATRAIAKRLRARGLPVGPPPESFVVQGSEGPLALGEEERARSWGASLAGTLLAPAPPHAVAVR